MIAKNVVDLLIINNKQQILLCKRTQEDEEYGDAWSIPGGGLEPNENLEEAIHREIKEELGCRIKWLKHFKSYSVAYEDFVVGATYFYGEISGVIRLNHELSEYRWFDINDPELLRLEFAFNQKDVVKDFVTAKLAETVV